MSQVADNKENAAAEPTPKQQQQPQELRLEYVFPVSTAAQPYSESLMWKFHVFCETAMTRPFEVVFALMSLEPGRPDVELDVLEIDPLPEGRSVFELEHDMPDIDDMPVLDLIGAHGISIVLRYAMSEEDAERVKSADKIAREEIAERHHIAFRGAEIAVEWADKKYEEEMPDEISAEMLTVKCVGVRGQKVARQREE